MRLTTVPRGLNRGKQQRISFFSSCINHGKVSKRYSVKLKTKKPFWIFVVPEFLFGCFSLIICWVEIKLFEFTKSPFPPVTRHRHKELSELFSFTTRICKNNSRNSLFFEILLYLWHVLNQAVKLTLKSNSVNFLGNEIIVDSERESNLNSIPSRIILDRIRPRPIYPPTWRQIPKTTRQLWNRKSKTKRLHWIELNSSSMFSPIWNRSQKNKTPRILEISENTYYILVSFFFNLSTTTNLLSRKRPD